MGSSPAAATNMFNLKKNRKMGTKVFNSKEERVNFKKALNDLKNEAKTIASVCKNFALTEGANKETQDKVFKAYSLPDALKEDFICVATNKKFLMDLMKAYLLRVDGVFAKKVTFTKIEGGVTKKGDAIPEDAIEFKSLKKKGFRGDLFVTYKNKVTKFTKRDEENGNLECYCYVPKESFSFGEVWSAIGAYFSVNMPDVKELENKIQSYITTDSAPTDVKCDAEKPISLDSRTAEDLVKGYIDKLSDANKKKLTKYNYLCVRIGKTGTPVVGFTNKPVKSSGVINFETAKYRNNVQG